MAKYARAVADNGYSIVPIRPGTKAPLGLDWSQRPTDVPVWLAAGYEHEYWVDKVKKIRGTRTYRVDEYGIGVLASKTPGVDIDVKDEGVSAHMVEFTRDLLGDTITRVGDAPKTLMVYRAEKPFAKVNSATYLDGEGRRTKIEVLAAGQQFVALAVHPDTKAPYKWAGKKSPHNTPIDSLPTITLEQAREIRDEFDRIAKSRGWDLVEGSQSLAPAHGPTAADDPFADVAPKVVGIDADEMRRLTMLIPPIESYDGWREIGMALYHQFDGSDLGLEIWDEWSSGAANYDADECALKWASFDIDGKGRAPLTARIILERSKGKEAERIAEVSDQAIQAIMLAQSPDELVAACKPYKSVAFSEALRNMLVGKLRDRYKAITNTPLAVADARKMLKYEDTERASKYSWCDGFVYVQFDDMFDNVKTQMRLTPKAFDGSYARNLLSRIDLLEGKLVPDNSPSVVARNLVQIPVVAKRMYMPGWDEVFSINGISYVNSFSKTSVPIEADEDSVAGDAAIAKVVAHAEHLVPNARDRGLFLDWLAYIVQTGRPNWGVFLQGVGGDGKTFWGDLMTAVLGMANVRDIRGAELKEKYSPWAEGHQFVFVEEVRLTGEHRYDAVNNIKPFITNSRVPIRRMGVDIYTVINVTAYMLTSNFKDGLPASEGERYFVLYSRWQDADKLKAWKDANPSYFSELFGCLSEAPSLRRWFLNRKLSDEFDPKARAPESSDMYEMADAVVDDETAALRRTLRGANDSDFSAVLLDSGLLAERMTGSGAAAPSGRRLSQLLGQAGLTFIGESGFGGKTRRWWSSEPERFRRVEASGLTKIDTKKVQDWVEGLTL